MNIDKLVEFEGDDLDSVFSWIDWKSYESEVVESFAEQLFKLDSMSYEEHDGNLEIIFNEKRFQIPLTKTGCDRYVTICSLVVILQDKYKVWLERESASGSDTHGFLVLSKDESSYLEENYANWVKEHLEPVTLGIDMFSGNRIPYLNSGFTVEEFHYQKPWWKFW